MTINEFKIRAYGWQELAILYAPNLTPESAGKRLAMWVKQNPHLREALRQAGWRRGQRVLTPLQVQRVVEYLGEP